MRWADTGIVLSTRPFGESSRVVSVLTHHHGRHAGLVKVPKSRPIPIETGTFVEAAWNARLPEHLGQWNLEATAVMGARLLSQPSPLAALSSACGLTDQCLAERHPYPDLYASLKRLIEDLVHSPNWQTAYVNYELALLKGLGFGLDLSVCAATGQTEELIFISPKTGRAVSRQAGEPYKAKLLPLPAYWLNPEIPTDIPTSLTVTGYFLSQHLTQRQGLPPMRQRLTEMVS